MFFFRFKKKLFEINTNFWANFNISPSLNKFKKLSIIFFIIQKSKLLCNFVFIHLILYVHRESVFHLSFLLIKVNIDILRDLPIFKEFRTDVLNHVVLMIFNL